MRLRWRVRLAIGGTTIAILGAISWATYSLFAAAQVRELDRELLARVQHEAENLVHSEGVVRAGTLRIGALDDHVKYAVLYDKSGKPVARSVTFAGDPPDPSRLPLGKPVDLITRVHLRGVLWQAEEGELLLAASREPLDEDLADLRRLLLELFAFGAVASIIAAGWIASRLTRSIEHLALVSQQISAGALDTRVNVIELGSPEARSLGAEMNQMVDSLQQALAAQRRFVSNAAHELRSPITVVRGELELTLRRERQPEEYKAAINEALGGVRDLQTLAENLLSLARVAPSGDQVCELGAVIEAALRSSDTRESAERGVSIVVDAPPVKVRGRASDLSRLFRNLIENALAHAPDRSAVRIQTDGTTIRVEDDGPGVDEAIRDRVFEPFVRGGVERTGSGAGLGLAIAREIARAAGGQLTLESPRQPTRFVVRLLSGES